MKTNLRAANLKEEYAETVLRQRAAELGILLDDDAKAKDFRIQLKRKASAFSPFVMKSDNRFYFPQRSPMRFIF